MQNTSPRLLAGISALLLLTPCALAQPAQRQATRSARDFRKLQVSGDVVRTNVDRVTSRLQWHKNLGGALAAGRRAGKPVVWIQALGDIDGFL